MHSVSACVNDKFLSYSRQKNMYHYPAIAMFWIILPSLLLTVTGKFSDSFNTIVSYDN